MTKPKAVRPVRQLLKLPFPAWLSVFRLHTYLIPFAFLSFLSFALLPCKPCCFHNVFLFEFLSGRRQQLSPRTAAVRAATILLPISAFPTTIPLAGRFPFTANGLYPSIVWIWRIPASAPAYGVPWWPGSTSAHWVSRRSTTAAAATTAAELPTPLPTTSGYRLPSSEPAPADTASCKHGASVSTWSKDIV